MKHTIAVQEEKERHKEELMQMKMQFFTDVSHEFRTPLTLMSHAVAEMEEEMPTNKYVHTLKRNTGKLSNMVNELLEIHRMDVYTPQLKANYISVNSYVQSIYFDSDQDVARADQYPNLTAAVNAANQYSQDQVKLMGNADTDANPQYNIALSERRVQHVAQYLVNHGVSADRLIGIANGDVKPVATNSTAAGKAENRRVDVYIHR